MNPSGKALWVNLAVGLAGALLWLGIGVYQRVRAGADWQTAALAELPGALIVLVALVVIRQMARRPRPPGS